jgi:hypothetical protein
VTTVKQGKIQITIRTFEKYQNHFRECVLEPEKKREKKNLTTAIVVLNIRQDQDSTERIDETEIWIHKRGKM